MEPYMPFSNDAILDSSASQEGSLEDLTVVTIPRNAPSTSTSTFTEEEPAEKSASTEATTKQAAPTRDPLKGPTHLAVTVSNPTEKLTAPQIQHEEQTKVEVPHSGYPGWMKALHLPWPVTAVEQTPHPLLSQSEDTTARVLGEESLASKGRRTPSSLQRQSWILCPHLGLPNQCKRLHCPQASRG